MIGVSPQRPFSKNHMNSDFELNQISRENGKVSDAAENSTNITVDSGACESIAPQSMFPNTPMKHSPSVGKLYGACGGAPAETTKTGHDRKYKLPRWEWPDRERAG